MKISVIIPTHNRQDKVKQTVAGLRKQDFPINEYEIIVLDDTSTPPVSFGEELTSLPKMSLVRLEGAERSVTRNTGAKLALGELLVFVDDDIFVEEDFLSKHWQAHIEFPDTLVVGAIYLPPENQNEPFVRFRQKLENSAVPRKRGLTDEKNLCVAANTSIKKTLFNELSGFDILFTSSEDQDLALRFTSQGKKIVYASEIVGLHYDSAFDIRSYCRRHEWGSRAMLPFYERYPDIPSNVEREEINGYVNWGNEPVWRSIRKIFKPVLASPIVVKPLFKIADLLERYNPQGKMIDGVYKLLLGAHIFRGYRTAIDQLKAKKSK